MERTPGKWEVEKRRGKYVVVTTYYEDETPVICCGNKAWPLKKDDAESIVKAVESHDELLEALKDITSYEYRSERVICQAPHILKCMCNKCIDERVKAVIAKAEKQ